jgi:hypothetical protein
MTLRRWAVAIVFGTIGWAAALEYDGGGGGGGASTDAERTELLLRVSDAQAHRALALDLATLYAAVAAFADVETASAAGYGPASGCMTSELGAQGIHFARGDLMAEPLVIADEPQLLMYEPAADGSLRFLGVEYLVFQQAWHDAGHVERPVLFGQTFDLNETLLDEPFYLLHVWIGQFNPSGVFANWNPLVDCSFESASAHGAGH